MQRKEGEKRKETEREGGEQEEKKGEEERMRGKKEEDGYTTHVISVVFETSHHTRKTR